MTEDEAPFPVDFKCDEQRNRNRNYLYVLNRR